MMMVMMMMLMMITITNYVDNNYDCECLSNINDNDARSLWQKVKKKRRRKEGLLPFCLSHTSRICILFH